MTRARTLMNCGTQIAGRSLHDGPWISGGIDCRLNDLSNLRSIARYPDGPTRGVEMAVVVKKCFAGNPVRFLVTATNVSTSTMGSENSSAAF